MNGQATRRTAQCAGGSSHLRCLRSPGSSNTPCTVLSTVVLSINGRHAYELQAVAPSVQRSARHGSSTVPSRCKWRIIEANRMMSKRRETGRLTGILKSDGYTPNHLVTVTIRDQFPNCERKLSLPVSCGNCNSGIDNRTVAVDVVTSLSVGGNCNLGQVRLTHLVQERNEDVKRLSTGLGRQTARRPRRIQPSQLV